MASLRASAFAPEAKRCAAWEESLDAIELIQLHAQVRHFERGLHRFAALVASARSRPLERLLDRLRRQHTEYHRNAGLDRNVLKPASALARNVLKVRRIATDDAAERNDRLVLPALRRATRNDRQLECTGHSHDREIRRIAAVLFPRSDGALHEPRHHEFIEP